MPQSAQKPIAMGGAHGLLQRLHLWWQRRHELGDLDRGELDRLAGELGMTATDLQNLVAQGARGAELLRLRLETLGITRTDIERVYPGLMRDLERTCSCCEEKSVCKRDLGRRSTSDDWKDYCPNAISLESVRRTKGRFPA